MVTYTMGSYLTNTGRCDRLSDYLRRVWRYQRGNQNPYTCSRGFRIEFGISNEIIRKYSETAWKVWTLPFFKSEKVRKFELCNFLCRKKLRKLDFVIFIGWKSSESWTLTFLMAEKFGK